MPDPAEAGVGPWRRIGGRTLRNRSSRAEAGAQTFYPMKQTGDGEKRDATWTGECGVLVIETGRGCLVNFCI
jgi:hypothetical protein